MSTHVPPDQALDMLAHRHFIRGIVRSLLRGSDGEEDVVQQTMLKACSEGPRDRGRLRPWLARIARNLAFDHLRMRRRRRKHDEERADVRPGEPSPADVLQREEERQRVVQAVLAMPPAYRAVLLMRFWGELTTAEIAQRLGEPDATIRSRLHRGIGMLRQKLDREFGGRAAWVTALLPFADPGQLIAPAGAASASTATFMSGPTPTTLGTATKISTTGALLMTKSKMLLSTIACAAVGLMAWLAWQSDGAPSPQPTNRNDATASIARGEVATRAATDATADEATTDSSPERLTAAPTGALTVQGVVVHDGNPQPNVPLTLQWFTGTQTEDAPLSEHELLSDSQGRFVWRGATRTEFETVRVSAPQARAQAWADSEVIAPDTTEVSLEVSIVPLDRVLFGRVHDGAGKPVSGVRLSINGWRKSATVSDADGRYELPVPQRSYPLVVEPKVHRHRLINGYMPDDATRHEFDIALVPGAAFEGFVVDENEAPVAGATVRASGLMGQGVETGADGRFVLTGAAPDSRHELTAKKPGYRRGNAIAQPGGEPSRIVLLPGLELGLQVCDLAGKPVVGATVHVVPEPHSGWHSRGLTDAAGKKRLVDLPPGPFDVIVQYPGFVRDRRTVDAAKTTGDVTIAMRPGFTVAGQVTDTAGEPMAGVSVYAEDPTADFAKRGVGTRAKTDAAGGFAINDLPPGSFTVYAHHDGYARASLPGIHNARTDLVLRLAAAPAVAGRVVDAATGEPIREFTVAIAANHEVQSLHISPKRFEDDHGYFRFQNWRMKAGAELFLEIRAPGYAPSRVRSAGQVNPPRDQNVVRLHVGATVKGTVRDAATNTAIAGAELTLNLGDGKDDLHRFFRSRGQTTTADANGKFAIANVAPGTHRVTVRHADYPGNAHGPFEVPAGDEPVTIEPTLRRGVTVRGRVTGAQNAAGWKIRALGRNQEVETRIGPDLTFTLEGLGPGRYHLIVKPETGADLSQQIQVGAKDLDGIELALDAGSGAIRGTVRGIEHGWVSITRVAAEKGQPTVGRRQKFDDGTFTFRGLAPGHYRIELHDRGWTGRGKAEIDVGAVEVPVEITFEKNR
ncbi:MAG: sigma-70 family RNA polymerase sigma factor [bacterium]|nr:sigma-70 family RNA polymerase sigma factor [bacterium]